MVDGAWSSPHSHSGELRAGRVTAQTVCFWGGGCLFYTSYYCTPLYTLYCELHGGLCQFGTVFLLYLMSSKLLVSSVEITRYYEI